MIEIAKDVYQISLFPRYGINAYLVGSVLVDAGIRSSGKRILKAIGSRQLSAHVLTHAHSDHQGASALICQTLNIPLWCGLADKAVMESGNITAEYPNPKHPIARFQQRFWAGPGHPVAKTLSEGDTVEDFTVIETPGHSAGHIALWRESDRTLIAGDVVTTMNLLTTLPGLHEPLPIFTPNPAQNRESIKKIAALEPALVAVGHGPPLTNTKKLTDLASQF